MKALFQYPKIGLFLLCIILPIALQAQVSDQFSDGDFSANPPWNGDIGDFEVNASQQLHLVSTGIDTSVLYTANTIMNDAEWNFWFRLSFAPSDNNYVRIYLVSDQTDIKGSLNGYFLRYGENGSADGLDLWRQNGNAVTKIIDGLPSPNAASSNQMIRLKVFRSALGEWELLADYAGGYNFQNIGSITDNTHSATSVIGVWCKYTASNSTGFYFDDVYAGPIIVDVTAPEIASVSILSADSISVIFSEPVSQASATLLTNYSIQNIGNPTAISYSALLPDRVKLALPSPLQSEQAYGLQISSVMDLAGNVMLPYTNTISFYQASANDVIISELMVDPTPVVALPDAEFIELYNRKNFPIDVSGWKIKVGNTVRTIPSGIIPVDSFLVLSINPLPAAYSNINAIGIPSFSALANTGATVSILSPSDVVINSVSYSSSWYQDGSKDDGGWTLEMINLQDLCNGQLNWIASADSTGGTPGRRNSVNIIQQPEFFIQTVKAINTNQVDITFSQSVDITSINALSFSVNNSIGNPDSVKLISGNTFKLFFTNAFISQTTYEITVDNSILNCVQQPISGNLVWPFSYYLPMANDVIISEIMADPDPPVALPNVEYLELYNRTQFAIDIEGWKIKLGASVRTIPSGIIPADSFIVLTVNPLPIEFDSLNAIAITGFPSITNTSGTVTLLSPNDEVLNQVSYHISWYNDAVKDDGGWSLELINPNDLCNGQPNWNASQHPVGGTPGARNSIHNLQTVSFEIQSATIIEPFQLQVSFSQIPDESSITSASFSVNKGIGSPDSAIYLGNRMYSLYFSNPFEEQELYELSIVNTAQNCVQQTISGDLIVPFSYYVPRQNDVIITEIMMDESPSQGLPEFEYVELYNRTALPIQLGDWKFSAGNSTAILPAYLLESNTYVTLVKIAGEASFSGNVLGVPSFPSLTNSGASLSLRNAYGYQVYSISYRDTWITESYKRGGGWSLEMKDVTNPCAGKENWAASIHPDGGTPGAENSVKGVVSDQSRPRPTRVGIPVEDSLIVYFSEPLRMNISAQQFSITHGIGTPAWAYLETPSLKTVGLKLNSALQSGQTYQLTFADSITDCVGNNIEVFQPFLLKMPEFPSTKDVIINEVLFDPKGNGEDYLELFNRSEKAIDLNEIFVGDYDSLTKQMSTIKTLTSRSAIVMPGEYLLLSRDETDILSNYSTTNPNAFWDIASMPSMSNSGGSIAVCDNNFSILDAFSFTNKFHFSLLSNADGVSLERINTETATQSTYNWTSASASVGYGTPGYKNSQAGMPAEQDDVITLSPEIFSPDQDGFDDILFIRYEFPTPGNVISINIYNELGQLMKKLVSNEYCGTTGEYTWDGGTDNNIRPKVGIYILMAEWFNENGEKGRAKKVVVLGTKL